MKLKKRWKLGLGVFIKHLPESEQKRPNFKIPIFKLCLFEHVKEDF